MTSNRLIVLFLLLPLCVSARVVPQGSAKAEAERFLRQVAPGRQVQLRVEFEPPRMTKSVLADPAYYVFTDERGGFVIAAGDDTVPPVLGYSTSGSFRTDNLPENLAAWLDMWRVIIEDNRASNAAPYQAPPATKSLGASKLIETALWGQQAPYNKMCPLVDGKRTLTGCVATAFAIALRYYEWPDSGTGTTGTYSYLVKHDDGTTSACQMDGRSMDHPFEWNKMPLSAYDGSWTKEQEDAVALLMRDCGAMVDAIYGVSSTVSSIRDIPWSLVQFLQYANGVAEEGMAAYPQEGAWTKRIKECLDELGPVIYSASPEVSNANSHAFVIDGYDENDYFHINWGWGGRENGFFVMPAFLNYTQGHRAILGMRKPDPNHPSGSLADQVVAEYDVQEEVLTVTAPDTSEFQLLYDSSKTVFDPGDAVSVSKGKMVVYGPKLRPVTNVIVRVRQGWETADFHIQFRKE